MSAKKKSNIAYVVAFTLVALYILCRIFLITTITVSGPSMEPTFQTGNLVVCTRVYDRSQLQVGDIIIFRHEGLTLIKRVAAVPGTEAYAADGQKLSGVMPEGKYFVLGDNAANSNDSRMFGPIDSDDIRYKYVGLEVSPVIWYGGTILIVIAIVLTVGFLERKAKLEEISKKIDQMYDISDNESSPEVNKE